MAMTVAGVLFVVIGARVSMPSGARVVFWVGEVLDARNSFDAEELGGIALLVAEHVALAVFGLALNVGGVALIVLATYVAWRDRRVPRPNRDSAS